VKYGGQDWSFPTSAAGLNDGEPILSFLTYENDGSGRAIKIRISQTQRLGPVSLGGLVMQKRRRFKHTTPLKDRLISFSREIGAKAAELRPGPEKSALLKRARLADTAAHISEWINSPGLQPPK
jgi:hypothetical protein